MRKLFFIFSFLFILSFFSYSQSLVDSSKSLIDPSKSLLDSSKSLVDPSKSLIDPSKSLIDPSKSLVDSSKSLVKESPNSIGVYDIVVEKNTEYIYDNTTESVYEDVYDDVYVNDYGKYLKIMTEKGLDARDNFVEYFSDWQWSGQEQDFFSYAESRAEQEKQLALCYDKALAKFGIGTAIIATTWIVAIVVPGGTICQVSVVIIAQSTTVGALSGGAIGAVSSCAIGYLQGKRGDELIYATVNGAADGYLVGAITGFAEGALKLASYAKNIKKISESYTIFADRVFDSSGNLLLDTSKVSKAGIEELSKILAEQGDDALEALIKVAEQNPKNLETAIAWINVKGIDGIHDILKWKGVIPKTLNKEIIEIAKQITESSIKEVAEELKQLPSIKLSVRELDRIRQDPKVLEELVKKYTGKSFEDGYLEFFIRISKKYPKQMEEIWNYSKDVRNFIKNNGIRAGGVHEWLMCENFCDFLIDPKWRKDGAFLCELLPKLTQSSDSVVMENVTVVLKDGSKEFYPVWTHLLESQKTLGCSSNPRSVIHNLIRDVVEQSNSAEELLVNLDKMVKTKFSAETYSEFSKTLADCLL